MPETREKCYESCKLLHILDHPLWKGDKICFFHFLSPQRVQPNITLCPPPEKSVLIYILQPDGNCLQKQVFISELKNYDRSSSDSDVYVEKSKKTA